MINYEYLKYWLQEHQTSPYIIRFEENDGSFIHTYSENVEVLSNHLHQIFNKKVT